MLHQKIFYSFCFSFLILAVYTVQSQAPGYKTFTLDNTSAKIFSLYKSNEGYIFVGSTDGLYKFDGIHFKKQEISNAAEDTVTAIFQDNAKDIWAGCQSGRIAKTTNSKFGYIEPQEGTPHKKITCFLQDTNGNIWFGTAGEGIYYFNNKRLFLINEENGLSDLNIYTLALASNGDVIAATDQGLAVCTANNAKKTVTMIGPAQGLPDYIVTAVAPAGNDNFWIGLQDKGICLYNHTSKKITVPAAVANWNKGQVNALHYTHNNLWITTQDSGLIRYTPSDNRLVAVPVLSAQQKNTGSIIEDNQGNMWLVADNNAVVKSACNALQMYPLYNDEFFITVHAILVDNENNFWTGTDMAVVKYTYTPNGYVSKKYPISGLDIKTDITSLYQDKFSNIWIGTMGKGIYVLEPATGKTRQLKEALATGSILSITGTGNTICTAGLEGAIVFELNDANKSLNSNYSFKSYNNIQNAGSSYIYNVFKDSKQRIWFATDGRGLTVLDNGTFTHYNKSNGIQDEHIYSVTEDKKGNIWFSTSNAGIYSFNGKTFTNYALKEGLSSVAVSAIKADRFGNIIVIHKDGIDIIDSRTGNFSYINTAQGISDINDNLGAVCTDSSGNIFVGTKKGILQYTALDGIHTAPETIIESVQLFLKDIDTTSMHIFKYDENNIRFIFTGLYFSSPENIFYQYKLEGLDSAWQLTTDNNKAFPQLPPGKYIFRVRSSLNKNFLTASEAAFAFEIKKAFWKTWWFIFGCSFLLTGLLYWYIKRREKHLTHVERLQGEKIKFEFELLRNQVNPHFLFNSFNTLISTIEEKPALAVEYVEQLSDFFRNIVNYRDKDVISLQEEIQLLQSYLYLQQKRYGNSLQLNISVDEKALSTSYLPPLSLQLLMENAIKHNAVSKETILQVQIFTEDDYIVVKNNINKKMNPEKGTGMGLQNIVSRYALLTSSPVIIKNTGSHFIVNLPVLKKTD